MTGKRQNPREIAARSRAHLAHVAATAPPVEIQGTVYFARCGDHIKIGFTRNVPKRLVILQTGNVERITLAGRIRGTASDERRLHEQFAKLWVRGEWFRAAPALLAYIERHCPRLDDMSPHAVYRRGKDWVDGKENFAVDGPENFGPAVPRSKVGGDSDIGGAALRHIGREG